MLSSQNRHFRRTFSRALLRNASLVRTCLYQQRRSGFHSGVGISLTKTGMGNGDTHVLQKFGTNVVRPFVEFHAGLRMCATNKILSSAVAGIEDKKRFPPSSVPPNFKIAGSVVERLMELSKDPESTTLQSTDSTPRIRSVTQMKQLYDKKLRHPYQEPDKSCSDLASRIVKNFRCIGKPRDVWAVVAGPGRGKTRTLHEIALKMNELPDTLAIPISFKQGSTEDTTNKNKSNTFVGFLSDGLRAAVDMAATPRDKADARDALAVASDAETLLDVATAVWSVSTNVAFQSAVKNMKHTIRQVAEEHGVSNVSQLSKPFAMHLLRKLIVSIVQCYRKQTKENKQGVNNFVLLVDEATLGQNTYGVHNMQQMLSAAVADGVNTLALPSDFGLKGRLVMSASNVKATGLAALSGTRQIQSIHLRDVLDTREIVKEWLPFYAPQWAEIHKKDSDAALKLELLMSTLVELPGAVEVAVDVLRGQDLSSLAPANISSTITRVREAIESKYSVFNDTVLPSHIVDEVMSRRDVGVELSDEVMSLIEVSALTSPVTAFWVDSCCADRPTVQELRVGVCNLWLMARNKKAGNEYLAPVAHMMDALLRHLENETSDASFPLKVVVRQVINLRLLASAATKKTHSRTSGGRNVDAFLSSFGNVRLGTGNRSLVGTVDGEWSADVIVDEFDAENVAMSEQVTNSFDTVRYLQLHRKAEFDEAMAKKDDGNGELLNRLHEEALNSMIPLFLHEATDIILDSRVAVQEVWLAATEGADGAWLMRNEATQETQLFLMDCTSTIAFDSMTAKQNTDVDMDIVADSWKRAEHWQRVSKMAKDMVDNQQMTLRKDSMAEALAHGRYRFLYLPAGHTASSVYGLFLESKAVEAMMGPFLSMYKVARQMNAKK